MKKSATILMAAAVVCLMGACKKDGVYNPKKKIANVYQSYEHHSAYYDGTQWQEETHSQPKELTERWKWDGNLLTEIGYAYPIYDQDGNVTTGFDITRFTYDGKQLTEVNGEDRRMTITYDGKKLDKIDIYYNGSYLNNAQPEISYAFTYDGKKISHIEATINEDDPYKASKSQLAQMVAQSFLPDRNSAEKVMASVAKAAKKNGAKSGATINFDLTWDGGNVTKISGTTAFGYNILVEFTYDDKNNPYQGFLFGLMGETNPSDESGLSFKSENNIVKAVYKYLYAGEDDEIETNEYTYTYDGKWPVSCTNSYSYEDDNSRSSSSFTTYFEYE